MQGSVRERALLPVLMLFGLVVASISGSGAQLIPLIARDDHVSLTSAQWSLTITLLAAVASTPTLGRLSDGPRRRAAVLTGIGLAFAGSVLCAIPLGFVSLLVGRALQGLGTGLTPVALSIARDHLPRESARRGVTLLAVTSTTGVAIGYTGTGLAADAFGLAGAFWSVAIVCGVTVALAAIVIPETPRANVPRRLDVTGSVLSALGLGSILLAIGEGARWGWLAAPTLGCVLAGLALTAVWVRHELQESDPLVDLRLMRVRQVAIANSIGFLLSVPMLMEMVSATRFVQTPSRVGYGFGASVFVAGLIFVPFSGGALLTWRITHPLMARIGASATLVCGVVGIGVAGVWLAAVHDALWESFVGLGLLGFGLGVSVAMMILVIMRAVPPEETGSALAVNQVLRMAGSAVGAAACGSVLETFTPAGQLLPKLGGYTATYAGSAGLCVLLVLVIAAVSLRAPRESAAPAPVRAS